MVTFDPYEECAVCGRFHYAHDADPNRMANHNFKPRETRTPDDACHAIRLSERRAVLLRVAGELRDVAAAWTTQHHPTAVTLSTLAAKYRREAEEVK